MAQGDPQSDGELRQVRHRNAGITRGSSLLERRGEQHVLDRGNREIGEVTTADLGEGVHHHRHRIRATDREDGVAGVLLEILLGKAVSMSSRASAGMC